MKIKRSHPSLTRQKKSIQITVKDGIEADGVMSVFKDAGITKSVELKTDDNGNIIVEIVLKE